MTGWWWTTRASAKGYGNLPVILSSRAAAIATLEQALSSTKDTDLALNCALAQLCLQERQFAASALLSGTPSP